MGLCTDIKITTIYYYVQNTFRNDRGIVNIYNLSDQYSIASQSKRCRVAYYDELALMATSNSLVFQGLLCISEGYFIWDSTNKIYLMVDANSGMI